ncbi:GIY-YIG nuclease family protein [Microvirga mediterraneensis]|uniref:GIY-YIG nuclease family protein n=1 Tax=Microvirga mediterraneensis TaxID=2754695 RepID=A0A838BN97_9HYPH|nr:GIY-YIG nuclease family protein [Microvirga mediterraneensis]MBA1156918.1 GIY-YIG nuclease family protein [Microvirga mediterraneensis]
MSDFPIGFYVYQLVDPRSGLPFYVGKGQGRRAWDHQRAVKTGKSGGNTRKVAKIQEILKSGQDVEVRIVAVYDTEVEALDHEFRLVDADPTLTNVMPGGCGRVESPEWARRRSEMQRRKLLGQRGQMLQAATERDLERSHRMITRVSAPSKQSDEVENWYSSLPEKDKIALARANPTTKRQHKARVRAERLVRDLAALAPQGTAKAAVPGVKLSREPKHRKRARLKRLAAMSGPA